MKKKISDFFNEVKAELKKVTWPEKKMLRRTTVIIVIFIFIMALYIGIIDLIFSKVIILFLR
ncbi:MAG TPA: preprotein translocase subunit SecE [Candidatus Ratteibacteria bacterium]|nr:preprotein translocase subunit SecE [Candidatus Ratteibacteria bacterium]